MKHHDILRQPFSKQKNPCTLACNTFVNQLATSLTVLALSSSLPPVAHDDHKAMLPIVPTLPVPNGIKPSLMLPDV
jgi:hypothetical protein